MFETYVCMSLFMPLIYVYCFIFHQLILDITISLCCNSNLGFVTKVKLLKKMGWDNVPKLKHTPTNVGEYKKTCPNTFKWIPNCKNWSLVSVPNIWEQKL